MIDFGMRIADCGLQRSRVACGRSARLIRNPKSPIRNRKALTLVELMVAIAIMGILASLLLGAAAVASEVARNARTKSLIARLHTLLIERYDGYRSQRVELRSDWATYATPEITGINFVPLSVPQREAAARLVGLRETMKFELPDRWSDILGMEVPANPVVVAPAAVVPPRFLQRSPALRDTYLRAYNRMIADNPAITKQEIEENESAECLYLIIMNATGDGEARGMFKPNDIDDTDEDLALEFIDGWGKPISFIRWAPGFDSDAQLSAAAMIRIVRKSGDDVAREAILADHDPFDLFRLDNPTTSSRGWRLLPLITSGGGDEELGLRFYGNRLPTLDPYLDIGNANYLGEATDDSSNLNQDIEAELAGDNITNHNVGELSRK